MSHIKEKKYEDLLIFSGHKSIQDRTLEIGVYLRQKQQDNSWAQDDDLLIIKPIHNEWPKYKKIIIKRKRAAELAGLGEGYIAPIARHIFTNALEFTSNGLEINYNSSPVPLIGIITRLQANIKRFLYRKKFLKRNKSETTLITVKRAFIDNQDFWVYAYRLRNRRIKLQI